MATAPFTYPQVPFAPIGAGLRTDLGTLIQPGGEVVAYVRSGGVVNGDHPEIQKRIYPTLNAALALCRSGYGDTVCVLPGHAENISAADQMSNLVAGTRIRGLGYGTLRPTFTWTAATSTFLFDVANTSLENCILNMDPGTGTTTVAAPITISAAGCQLLGNQIRMGSSATAIVTVGINTTAAADDLVIDNNFIYGDPTAEIATAAIQLIGCDRLRFTNNIIDTAQDTTSKGTLKFVTTASLNILMLNNRIKNSKAASTVAITNLAACTGFVDDLFMTVLSNNTAALTGAATTGSSLSFGRKVYVNNLVDERAALYGTESA